MNTNRRFIRPFEELGMRNVPHSAEDFNSVLAKVRCPTAVDSWG